MIVKRGNEWILYTKDGTKILGKFRSHEAAEQREAQIQYFLKNKK